MQSSHSSKPSISLAVAGAAAVIVLGSAAVYFYYAKQQQARQRRHYSHPFSLTILVVSSRLALLHADDYSAAVSAKGKKKVKKKTMVKGKGPMAPIDESTEMGAPEAAKEEKEQTEETLQTCGVD